MNKSCYQHKKQDLLFELIRTNFKSKHSDSLLGLVWIFLQPFFNFVILYFVFKYFRGNNPDPNFAPKLMFSIITFNYIRQGIISGSNSLRSYASIVTKVYFKRILAIYANIVVSLIDYLINIVVVTIIFIFTNRLHFNFQSIAYFTGIILISTLFIFICSLIFSIVQSIISDLRNMFILFFQGLFWLSGIFYDLDNVRYSFRKIIFINPISFLIDSVKKSVVLGQIDNLNIVVIFLLALLVALPFSIFFFRRNIDKIIEYL